MKAMTCCGLNFTRPLLKAANISDLRRNVLDNATRMRKNGRSIARLSKHGRLYYGATVLDVWIIGTDRTDLYDLLALYFLGLFTLAPFQKCAYCLESGRIALSYSRGAWTFLPCKGHRGMKKPPYCSDSGEVQVLLVWTIGVGFWVGEEHSPLIL